MSSLSQALRLEDLPSSHSAFQGHAAHIIEWPTMLRPKDSEGTCIPSGVTTFLQAASRRSPSSDYSALSATPPSSVLQIGALTISGRRLPPSLLPIGLTIPGGASRVQQEGLKRNALGGVFLAAPSALCGSPVFAWGISGLPTLPLALPSHCNVLVHTPTTELWFLVYWLTSQARYVRVCIPRRAIHASCESPWHFSAKHHVLGACFSLMAPFRTRFSRR